MPNNVLVYVTGSLVALAAGAGAQVESLEKGFLRPPDDAKIMMRWWWFGPSVDKARLEREMRLMKEGGIGGFEVQPVYPLSLDDPETGIRTLPFLSEGYLDAIRFTAEKAKELGLRIDLTLGSGWPYGGPHTPISEASGRLRIDRAKPVRGARRVPLPNISAGEKLLAVYAGRQELIDIRDGAVWLPTDYPEVQFFISSRTGQMVKRPSVGADGFVLDHYSRQALQNHLHTVADPVLKSMGSIKPYAVFCDSLEVYGGDWTSDLLSEFKRRRGYDLKPLLPALADGMDERSAGVKDDWGLTLTELLNERFLAPLRDWSRKNGTRFRIQGYGTPPATISSYSYADLPEGEGPQWKTLRASRWASSASHLLGKTITSSETWTWIHSPSFRATPLDVKAEADLHFLQGINQLIGHGWPYTPEGVEYPGWRFYAAGVFNEKNPWWIVMPELSQYLQRVSFMMRQGRPANDVAFYLPNHDAYAHFAPGRVDLLRGLEERVGKDAVARVLESGFNLDFFDDGTIEQALRYKIILLPGVERIPLQVMRKLEAFVKNGGTLVATRRVPALAPGLMAPASESAGIEEISKRLFEGASSPGRFVANENRGLSEALASRIQPDVSFTPADPSLGFVHRSGENAEIYFVVNSSNVRQKVTARFRVTGKKPEWWDPFTGLAAAAEISNGSVAMDLEPYGSRIIVFSNRSLNSAPQSAVTGSPIDLSSDWKVSIGSRSMVMPSLRSWAEDESTRYYSGVATYEKDISLTDPMSRGGLRLDFGEGVSIPEGVSRNGMQAWIEAPVRDAAVVYINGGRAGAVWRPPYWLDVTGKLKAGANVLRIDVANTAINYMAGHKQPDYKLLNLRYGVRFEPQDMDKVQVLPSGLLGPVRLIPMASGR